MLCAYYICVDRSDVRERESTTNVSNLKIPNGKDSDSRVIFLNFIILWAFMGWLRFAAALPGHLAVCDSKVLF